MRLLTEGAKQEQEQREEDFSEDLDPRCLSCSQQLIARAVYVCTLLYSALRTYMYVPTYNSSASPSALALSLPWPWLFFSLLSLLSQQIKLLVPQDDPPARDRGPSWEGKRIVSHLDRRPTSYVPIMYLHVLPSRIWGLLILGATSRDD